MMKKQRHHLVFAGLSLLLKSFLSLNSANAAVIFVNPSWANTPDLTKGYSYSLSVYANGVLSWGALRSTTSYEMTYLPASVIARLYIFKDDTQVHYIVGNNVSNSYYFYIHQPRIRVDIPSPPVGAKWRLTGPETTGWYDSGVTTERLVAGDYAVEFSAVPGYTAPPSVNISTQLRYGGTSDSAVAAAFNSTTTAVTASPYDLHDNGALHVVLEPGYLETSRWRISESGSTNWLESGSVISNLVVGSYEIQFLDNAGWIAPSNVSVLIDGVSLLTTTGHYYRVHRSDVGISVQSSAPIFKDCVIRNFRGHAVEIADQARPHFENVIIERNAGAMELLYASASLASCSVFSNLSEGATLSTHGNSSIGMTNVSIHNNCSTGTNGIIFIGESASLNANHISMGFNSNTLGRTICNNGTITMINSLLWDNMPLADAIVTNGQSITLLNNCRIQANSIDLLPPHWTQSLELLAGSPCIDAGTPYYGVTDDIIGNLRPYDGNSNGVARSDIGAYEFYGSIGEDSDGDGIYDAFEIHTYQTFTNNVDTDNDGIRDGDELIAGTSPANRRDLFCISGATTPASLSNCVIKWQSVTNRRYSVFSHTNLSTPWPSAPVYQIQGDGTQKSYTNTEPVSPLYFRLGVELSP